MNKKMQRLLVSAVVGLLIIVLAVSILITLKNNKDHRAILDESVKSNLISISIAARDALNIEKFDSYNSREDIDADRQAYDQTLASLRSLQEMVGATYIYALKQIDNQYYFIFDTDPDPYPDDPGKNDNIFGEYDDLSQVYLDAFNGKNSAGIMNVADRWGNFNTGAVPVWNDGKVIGIIGADIEDNFIRASQQAATFNIVILVIILSAVMSANIALIRRFVVKPISRLTESVSKTNIDENAVYGKDRDDEIGELARKIQETLGKAQSASRAKSDFLATMSHEIRTPLNAIIGIAQIELHRDNLPDEYASALEKIHSSGKSLLGIINDILDMSKIETGKLELNPAEYETPSLINDTVQLNAVRLGSKPIDFILELNENLPSRLYGDELRIKQILNNLLSNAIKYTEKGFVKLSVSHTETGGDIMLRFTVEDTGQGIKPEDLQNLFSEYLRFNTAANRTTEGAGLGLGIAKQLAEMMGGTVHAESEYGTGSIFIATLKQKAVECPAIGAELAQRLSSFTFTGGRQTGKLQITREPMPYGSVLVVDDVETNLFVAEGFLSYYKISVETADSGFTAIENIKSGKTYDIIFMDHMMPQMDGMETTQKLRGLGYTGVIVALTANALVGNEALFMQKGFDGFISKPIDAPQMNAVLNRFIRDRYPEEAKKYKPETITENTETDPKVLQIFRGEAERAVVTLRETIGGGDIKLFTTTAHAMKSALANVGEHEASALAFGLESAGLNGNMEFISANMEEFIETLEVLIDRFRPAETAEAGIANAAEDTDYLAGQLQIIKTACEAYDDDTAYAALDRLKEKAWSIKTAETLEQIRDMLYVYSDFEKAAGMAGALCEISI